jgi:putative spermidine/putrescine transport system substrate-binding protein
MPKGAPNLEEALEFIRYATSTEGLPPRRNTSPTARRAVGECGRDHLQGRQDRDGAAPADRAGEHDERAGNLAEFWVDHDAELNERFQAWLAQ